MKPARTEPGAYHYLLFAVCFLGGVFGGVASTLMSAYLPDVLKALQTPGEPASDSVGAVINAAFPFGMMFGGLLLGFFGDRFGRKPALQVALGCIGIFMILTGFSAGFTSVGIFRFFTGFGVGGILMTGATYLAEEWPEQTRNIALGILSITIPVGIFSAGLITFNFSDWRAGFRVGLAPLLLAGLAHFRIRESGAWRQKRTRDGARSPAAMSVFHPSVRRDLWLGSAIYGSMLIGLWAVFLWLPTWVEGLADSTGGQKARGTSMMLFAIGGLAGGFVSGWLSNLFGVKRTTLVCFAAVFILTFCLFKLNSALHPLLFLEIGLIALFFGLSQGVLNGYIPELFPTEVRASATGFCFNIGRIFTASVVFFVGWLETALGGIGNALFLFSFVFLLGFLATLFAREPEIQ
ncbi:MAG: MFS transporter [Saprospiraceae bacterium]|nr:MFS transporter [Saprospiraceae bacterium]